MVVANILPPLQVDISRVENGALSVGGWEVAAGRRGKLRGAVFASTATQEPVFNVTLFCGTTTKGALQLVFALFNVPRKPLHKEAFFMFKTKQGVKTLATVAVMVAAEIVLSRFLSISTYSIKIGFGFLPIAIVAMLYGPLWAAAAAGTADFLGAVLFPIGPYFPGFTLTALLTGAVFGVFLHRQRNFPRVLAAVVTNNVVLSLLVNTLWISILYGKGFLALLPGRIIQCLVLMVVQTVVLWFVSIRVTHLLQHKTG